MLKITLNTNCAPFLASLLLFTGNAESSQNIFLLLWPSSQHLDESSKLSNQTCSFSRTWGVFHSLCVRKFALAYELYPHPVCLCLVNLVRKEKEVSTDAYSFCSSPNYDISQPWGFKFDLQLGMSCLECLRRFSTPAKFNVNNKERICTTINWI
jgi:hypothetical protein